MRTPTHIITPPGLFEYIQSILAFARTSKSQNAIHSIPSGKGRGAPHTKGRVTLARENRHRGAKRSAKQRRAA